METGLTVGNLMDQMKTLNPDAPVVTDTGDVIYTIAPEKGTSPHAHIAATTLDAHSTDPVSVDDFRTMFAYYNVPTPRSRKAGGPCRESLVLLRAMGDDIRHISAVGTGTGTDTDTGTVILHTEPADPGTTIHD